MVISNLKFSEMGGGGAFWSEITERGFLETLDKNLLFSQKPACASPLADLRGGFRDARPPWDPNSFIFKGLSGKKLDKIIPIWELAHPPGENPGSATASQIVSHILRMWRLMSKKNRTQSAVNGVFCC